MALRLITDSDINSVYEIYMSALANPFMGFERMPREKFEEVFLELQSRGEFLAFEQEGSLAAVVILSRKKWRTAHVASIGSLAVAPAFLGQGVGSKVMNEVMERLRQEGIRRVELIVESDNTAGIRFYEKLGFQKEGTLQSYFRREGEDYIDDYMMALILE